MEKNWNMIWSWIMHWGPILLGLAWIVLPDPIIGPIDDILVAALEIAPIITKTVKKIRNT